MKTTKENVIFEVLQETGLNWTVSKKPLQFVGNNGNAIEVPNQFVNVRSDNEKPLGTVGNQYTVLQNHEVVETVYETAKELFDADAQIQHPWNNATTLGSYGNIGGGSLRDGSAIFVQLELPSAYIGKSDINRYVTMTNLHDGSKAIGYGTTNQVVCCANTFAIAHKELSKIRHTVSMTDRINEAKRSLRRMMDFEEQQMEVFHKASNMDLRSEQIREVMNAIFGKDKLNDNNPSTKLQNQVKEFSMDLDTSMAEQGQTLWALFNGVTRYTNHSRSVKDKDYSLMFGLDATINQRAYDLVEAWVK